MRIEPTALDEAPAERVTKERVLVHVGTDDALHMMYFPKEDMKDRRERRYPLP